MLRFAPLLLLLVSAVQERRPNVLLIITDDQGYGDLGCHGNDKIKTPNLDALAKQSFRFESFHVSPVCSPTRSSLLTGRYTYRTGVVDTFTGRSMMHADEVTLAELLGGAGYRTGIFGKWHLGDNYPLRAMDQGFQESLTIRGGGLGQASDPPGGDHYTDATMYRNGKPIKTQGYCSDVYTSAAIDFIASTKDKPFFAYVPFNAPHTPLEAPDGYLEKYKDAGLDDVTARIYAMVTNIDDNIGRLLKAVGDDTIVIFMTDNGPQQKRYNAGMRALKGTVYEGGIRVPFFLRWPSLRKEPRSITGIAAHIDVTPTLLEACRVEKPKDLKMDGRSLLPALETGAVAGDRTIFLQWHRGDVPEKGRACTAIGPRWKLVRQTPAGKPELFDLLDDPGEKKDVAADHADVVEQLNKEYEAWFDDVKKTREFAPPRIVLDPAHEDPVVLSRQEMRAPKPGLGFWLVEVAKEANYQITLYFKAPSAQSSIVYKCDGGAGTTVGPGQKQVTLKPLIHHPGRYELSAYIEDGPKVYSVDYVELKRVD